MITPSDINKNIYEIAQKKYKEETKGLINIGPVGVNLKMAGLAVASIGSLAVLHKIYPPLAASYPAYIGLAKNVAFFSSLLLPALAGIVGEMQKHESVKFVKDLVNAVVESRGLNKDNYELEKPKLKTLEAFKDFYISSVDRALTRKSLMMNNEGFETLGDMLDYRIKEDKEKTRENIKEHNSKIVIHNSVGNHSMATGHVAMSAASHYGQKVFENNMRETLIIDYCERRNLDPQKILDESKKDISVLKNLRLEKIDTVAYYVEQGRNEVREAFGKDLANGMFSKDELLLKREENIYKNVNDNTLETDHIINKMNESKKQFLEDVQTKEEITNNKKHQVRR